jgi:hypothetical protein
MIAYPSEQAYKERILGIWQQDMIWEIALGKKRTTRQRKRRKQARRYSIRIAGASSFNSAKLAFLDPTLSSSRSIPTSFVQIHVDAYIFTLSTISNHHHY